MAIAFDNATDGSASASSLTFSHTCSGSDRILFVSGRSVGASSNTDSNISGITYGGVAMTKINEVNSAIDWNWSYLYYLINPASGANNVVITGQANVGVLSATAASYTGAKQSAQPDNSNTAGVSTGSSLAVSITSVADNCWMVGGGFDVNGAGVTSAGANTTVRATGNNSQRFYDSNGAITPAGSRTLNLNDTNGAARLVWCAATFAPVAAAGPAGVKTIKSLAKASVKTVNGLAIASVKTIKGLA